MLRSENTRNFWRLTDGFVYEMVWISMMPIGRSSMSCPQMSPSLAAPSTLVPYSNPRKHPTICHLYHQLHSFLSFILCDESLLRAFFISCTSMVPVLVSQTSWLWQPLPPRHRSTRAPTMSCVALLQRHPNRGLMQRRTSPTKI